MNITELILLIFGGIVFTVSFFLPSGDRKEKEAIGKAEEEEIKDIIGREVEEAKTKINDIVDETITYSMEKTERSMERLTNEKIMAVNEYSDTVLEQINKNHKEAVFLYDMLNDKHENLKNTVSEAVKTASEVKQTVKDAEVTAREAKEQAVEIKEQISAGREQEKIQVQEATQEQIPVTEKVFIPIQAPRVEVVAESMAAEMEREPEKPKKKTIRKTKTEVSAQKEETADSEKTEKASKVDLSMAAPGKTGGRNSNERILELHKAGKSNMAIAKELGLGIGEVKLVIDLFEGI